MIIFPAIDLKDGACVRLVKGDMEQATTFNDDPAAQADQFMEAGAEWIHVVDLNGAFEGKPINHQAVKAILAATPGVPIQLGGGVRSIEIIEQWLDEGVSRAVLGTISLRNPELVKHACQLFPGQIAVGIDANNGKVAVEGWAHQSDITAVELAQRYEDAGVAAIIYTDIARDGVMKRPNIEETVALAEEVTIPVILSGGVTKMDDLLAIKDHESNGINGVIIGRALYDDAIDLKDAVALSHS